jgi:hypothetical protein
LMESVIDDVFPSWCNLYCFLWFRPTSQLGFAVAKEHCSALGFCDSRQTRSNGLPGREPIPFETKLSNALIREFVIAMISFSVQPVLRPLVLTHLASFAVALRNIAVPVVLR